MATKKTKLKALLVGVTEYQSTPRDLPLSKGDRPDRKADWLFPEIGTPPVFPPTTLVNSDFADDMRSAALDVEEMLRLVGTLVKPEGEYETAEVLVLTERAETTEERIRQGLEWLASEADDNHQLLFYFSGHGRLFERASGVLDEALLPSDHDWNSGKGRILEEDMLARVGPALQKGANLEVVLEACSAAAFVDFRHETVREFGCFLGAAGAGTVWSASLVQQSSHSGPVPTACPRRRGVESPVQGLFTYFFCFFCWAFPGWSRQDVLTLVHDALQGYRRAFNDGRCCGAERRMGDQVPSLYTNAPNLPPMDAVAPGSPLSKAALVKPDATPCPPPIRPGAGPSKVTGQ